MQTVIVLWALGPLPKDGNSMLDPAQNYPESIRARRDSDISGSSGHVQVKRRDNQGE